MSKSIDILRKIIREEVRKAIKEEISLLKEEVSSVVNQSPTGVKKENIKKNLESKMFPLTLNEAPQRATPKFDTSNPLGSLLNETAISMTTDDVHSFGNNFSNSLPPKQTSVGSVKDMLSNARASSNIEMVEIDTVPDFSGMMNTLKNKGLL